MQISYARDGGVREIFRFYFSGQLVSKYLYTIPGKITNDQTRKKKLRPPPSDHQLHAGALRWSIPWLQGWQGMPPTVAQLRGAGDPVTFSTFPPGNYVANTHSFLLEKILS